MRGWRLPIGLIVGGLGTVCFVGVLPRWPSQTRLFLVLGLSNSDVYTASFFVGPLVLLVGLAIAAWRLELQPRTRVAGVLVAIVVFAGGAFLAVAGFWCLAFSDIDNRTEIALENGRSIVVTSFFWHHCDINVRERNGIYLGEVIGASFDELPCDAFRDGDYTVEQDGRHVTLRAGGEYLAFSLSP